MKNPVLRQWGSGSEAVGIRPGADENSVLSRKESGYESVKKGI